MTIRYTFLNENDYNTIPRFRNVHFNYVAKITLATYLHKLHKILVGVRDQQVTSFLLILCSYFSLLINAVLHTRCEDDWVEFAF